MERTGLGSIDRPHLLWPQLQLLLLERWPLALGTARASAIVMSAVSFIGEFEQVL